MNFAIKIYGAPYSFDLYEGSKEDLNYFRFFDNQSKESVKMTIERQNNRQIVYNYLRYGYITNGGRPGSFFGLSVVFYEEYCSDFNRIYSLFEAVYGTVLKNAVLLDTQVQGEGQAKYKISQFAEAEGEIERIKGVLGQNIHGALAKFIKPMNFPNTPYDDRELRLSVDANNDLVTNAVSKYATVSISPAYSSGADGKEVKTVPRDILRKIPGEKSEILARATDWLGRVTSFQSDLLAHQAAKQDLKPFYSTYRNIMAGLDRLIQAMGKKIVDIQSWCNVDPTNPILIDAQKEIGVSKKSLDKAYNSLLQSESLFAEGGTEGIGDNDDDNSPKPFPWWKNFIDFIDKHRKSFIAASAALVLIIGLLVWHNHKGDGGGSGNVSTVETKCDSIMNLVREEMSVYQWVNAYKHCKEITENEAYNGYGRLQDVTDTMDLCRNNYKEYCLRQCVPENYAKKEDATQWFKKEMETVDCWDYSQEIQTIESRYPVATLAETVNPVIETSNPTNSPKPRYEIRIYQDNQPITSITHSRPTILKCYNGSGKEETGVVWVVEINGNDYKQSGNQFTPKQENNGNITIVCKNDRGILKKKTIRCDIEKKPSGQEL